MKKRVIACVCAAVMSMGMAMTASASYTYTDDTGNIIMVHDAGDTTDGYKEVRPVEKSTDLDPAVYEDSEEILACYARVQEWMMIL